MISSLLQTVEGGVDTGLANELNEIWTDDLLGRRSDAELLIKFLLRRFDERQQEGQSGAYVVNLNAAWGHGKTFFWSA